jgi:hypothetical protein
MVAKQLACLYHSSDHEMCLVKGCYLLPEMWWRSIILLVHTVCVTKGTS